jgi:DNA repair photolyase
MQRLVEAGIPCGVFLAPILPGLTDSEAAIDAVAAAARAHGASWFWASPLRLAPLVKEHYLGWVEESHPELLPRYERAYPRSDPPRPYQEWLDVRVGLVRERHGFGAGRPSPVEPPAGERATAQEGLQFALPL